MSFQDIPPFFEPSSPPPALLNLLAQTEIGKVYSSPRLLAQEELGNGFIRRPQVNHVRFSPYPKPSRQIIPPKQNMPLSPSKKVASESSAYQDVSMMDPDSESSSDLDPSVESEDEDEDDMGNNKSGLIPKPEGEAGRPGRGGYNLEQTLGWPKKEYEHIKKFMKKLVEEHLEPSKNFSSQSLSSLANVRALASDRFPALRNYADHWPVMDFIRLELKYTCGRARLQEDKKLVKVGKAKVGKHKTKTSE